MVSCEIRENFKNNYFGEHLRTTILENICERLLLIPEILGNSQENNHQNLFLGLPCNFAQKSTPL